ncbi:hypothetical protein [Halococcoides cellulosivorans]|uniref:Uncharacterized protein n=1 Tax=Halococcoides cellulosivorans TaxID=1679096 RepID=A0A2R4WYQ6_9EURY|nr:hypothetical protein [Halococcoides cellulosivorans]AWB26662.1 hypothetical protein HARCEL1_02510 [Halococcoides cellulosivorans]
MAEKNLLGDGMLFGMALVVVASLGIFGAMVYGLVAGVDPGPYGSIPAATVLAGLGVAGSTVGYLSTSGRLATADATLARDGGMACLFAGFMLAIPLTGTPLPIGFLRLLGGVLCGAGGIVLLGLSLWPDAIPD